MKSREEWCLPEVPWRLKTSILEEGKDPCRRPSDSSTCLLAAASGSRYTPVKLEDVQNKIFQSVYCLSTKKSIPFNMHYFIKSNVC